MLGKLGQLCCVSSTDDGGIGRVLFEIDRSHANPAKPERPRPNEAEFGQSWAELDHVWVKLASAGLNSAHSGRHRASPERFRPIVGELGRFRDGFGRSARSTRHRPGPEMDPTLTPLRPPIGPQHRPASDVPQMFEQLPTPCSHPQAAGGHSSGQLSRVPTLPLPRCPGRPLQAVVCIKVCELLCVPGQIKWAPRECRRGGRPTAPQSPSVRGHPRLGFGREICCHPRPRSRVSQCRGPSQWRVSPQIRVSCLRPRRSASSTTSLDLDCFGAAKGGVAGSTRLVNTLLPSIKSFAQPGRAPWLNVPHRFGSDALRCCDGETV